MKRIIIIGVFCLLVLTGCNAERCQEMCLKQNITEWEYLPDENQCNCNPLESYFEVNNLSINPEILLQPQGINFFVDYVNFTDGNLTVSIDEEFLFSFNEIDYIEWNIKNKTYRYVKENAS